MNALVFRATRSALLGAALLFTPLALERGLAHSPVDRAALATEAYLYGYPLMMMELTRRAMTNVPSPTQYRAPMGEFAHLRKLPAPGVPAPSTPNPDLLYSTAWVDLSQEPYVLSLPDMRNRYFVVTLLDGWTTVMGAPGKRTSGTKAQEVVLVGPDWKGSLPEGLRAYKCPTQFAWIIGQILSNGRDYHEIHSLQDRFRLIPLRDYDNPFAPPPEAAKGEDPTRYLESARDQISKMSAEAYFTTLAALLKVNPPRADTPMAAQMRKIDLLPEQEELRFDALDPTLVNLLQAAPRAALAAIRSYFGKTTATHNGWTYCLKSGIYGTNYLQRASLAYYGLGANRAEDTVYPQTRVDATGAPLSGEGCYLIRFKRGGLPPVNGYWSLTLYNSKGELVQNSANRVKIAASDRLRFNSDGSLDVIIQKEHPGGGANWLPAPEGEFTIVMRLYWPKEAALKGDWKVPPVQRLDPQGVDQK